MVSSPTPHTPPRAAGWNTSTGRPRLSTPQYFLQAVGNPCASRNITTHFVWSSLYCGDLDKTTSPGFAHVSSTETGWSRPSELWFPRNKREEPSGK